jgi:hypothetical protein
MDVAASCQSSSRPANYHTAGACSRGANDNNPRGRDRRVGTNPGSGQRLSRSRSYLLFQRNFGSGPEPPEKLQIVRDLHPVCVKGRLSRKCGVLSGQRDYVASGCGRFACHCHRRDHGGTGAADFGAIHALRVRRRAPAGRGGSGYYTGRIDWKHRRLRGDAQEVTR